MNRIQKEIFTLTKDYSNKEISYVLEEQTTQISQNFFLSQFAQKNLLNEIISLIQKAEQFICIQSSYISNQEILDTLLAMEQKGVRIYILLQEEDKSQKFLQALNFKSLIRVIPFFITTCILIDPNTTKGRGVVFSDILTTEKLESEISWLMQVQESFQVKRLYYNFCRLFWNEAKWQISLNKEPLDSTTSPFGEFPERDREFSLEGVRTIVNNTTNGSLSLFSLREDSIEENTEIYNCQILSNDKCYAPQTLETLIDQANTIYLNDTNSFNFFQFVIDNQEGYFFPSSQKIPELAVFLSEQQKAELLNYFDIKITQAKLKTYHKKKYKEIKNPFYVLGKDTRYTIQLKKEEKLTIKISLEKLKQVKEKNEVAHELDRVLEEKPHLKEPFSLQVIYQIEFFPLSIPKSTEKDTLQKQWEEIDLKYKTKLKELKDYATFVEEKKKSITEKVFSSLKSLFAGKTHKVNIQLDEIQKLEEINFLQSSNKENLVKQVNQIVDELNQDFNEIQDKIEEQTQKIQWEEKKEKLDKELQDLEKNLQEKSNSIQEFISNFEKTKAEKETEIHSLEGQVQTLQAEEKKKAENDLEDKKKSLNAFLNSKKQDQSKLEKERDQIQAKIKSKEEELKSHGEKFVYRKTETTKESSLQGIAKTPQKTSQTKQVSHLQFSLPKEEPPKVGILYNYQDSRYLAIEFWEEYETAFSEAQRLKAKLCILEGE